MVTCQGSTRYWNYLEVYWPCAGGLSTVNAIGTHLRDPINFKPPVLSTYPLNTISGCGKERQILFGPW